MNPNDDPETLERRSDSIRADVDETLSELQRTFSPSALVDRSMNLLRDHGGEMATNVLETVRRNPVPVLLMAAGAAWMVSAQLQSSRGDSYASSDAREGKPGDDVDQNAAHVAADAVSESTRKMKEGSRRFAQSARETSRHAGANMARLLREHPLAVGAAGILTGALIGALLPETAQEDRLMGQARDRVVRKARSAGEQGLDEASDAVNGAMERTEESLRGGGASPGA